MTNRQNDSPGNQHPPQMKTTNSGIKQRKVEIAAILFSALSIVIAMIVGVSTNLVSVLLIRESSTIAAVFVALLFMVLVLGLLAQRFLSATKLPDWIMGLTAFITAVVGFISLWQGDMDPVTIVLLAIGTGGGWLVCAYLAFKRTPPLIEGGKGAWQYPRWRSWALAGLIIIPLLTAGGVGYHLYQQAQLPIKVVVLVANFDGPEPQKYRVTETVLGRLHQALARYDDVKVEALGRAITEAEGSTTARAEGEKRKAAIVIWGWYGVTVDAVPLSVHFEVLRPPEYLPELGPEVTGLVQTMAIAELESFTLQTRLSAEMAYLSLFTVGMARYAAEDLDGAITCFSHALGQTAERVPALDQSTVYFYRGVAYADKGDYDRAIADYDQAIQLKPDLTEAYSNRGAAYRAKGDYDRAIADYDQAIQLQPDYATAYNNRGNAYTDKGDYDRAIADYDQAIQFQPDFAEAYYNRGVAYAAKGDHDQAIADYDQAIQLKPDYAKAYNNRGIAYAAKGDYDLAIAHYDEAIRLKLDYAEAYVNRGVAYRAKGDYDRAIADYDQAIQLQPDFAVAYNNRGNARRAKGDYDQAIEDYQRALVLQSELGDRAGEAATLNNIGLVHRALSDYERALAYYEQALAIQREIDDRDGKATTLSNIGSVYYTLSDYEQALAHYEQALAIQREISDPAGEARTLTGIGSVYYALSEYEQALAYYEQALAIQREIGDRQGEASGALNLGLVYEKLGKHEQAIAAYDQAIQLQPDFAEAYYNRGLAYTQKGEKEKAIADFVKVLELSRDPDLRQQAEEQLKELRAK